MVNRVNLKKCAACGSVLKHYKTALEQLVRNGVYVMQCGACGCEMCIRCGSTLKRRVTGTLRGLECVHCGYVLNIRAPRVVVK
jgi:hypothetical protein